MRAILASALLLLTAHAAENVDLAVVHRIKDEAFEHSQVMDDVWNLTDRYGPRLTASPEWNAAAEWAVKRLQSYGLTNVHLERWGDFGRSWAVHQYSVEMMSPQYAVLNAAPLAWLRATNGPVSGEIFFAPLAREFSFKKAQADLDQYMAKWKGKLRGKIVLLSEPQRVAPSTQPLFKRYTDAELAELAKAPVPVERAQADLDQYMAKWKGKLRGKIVLLSEPQRVAPSTQPLFKRYTDAELAELAKAPVAVERAQIDLKHFDINKFDVPEDPQERQRVFAALPRSVLERFFEMRQELANRRNKFLDEEGVLAVMSDDRRSHDALVFAESAGSYKAKDPLAPPSFTITAENYNRLIRLARKNEAVRMQVNLKADVSNGPAGAFNIIGEIPGSGQDRQQIVMVGAHFDSWHSATGATDNAAGSAVMIEVMRILKALNLPLDRTIRVALWSGEEEGLLGSRAYVKEHFGDPKTMKVTAAHANLSGYFNLDNGSGKIRGVYLQGNDAMRPIFEQWFSPFRDEGVGAITIRNTGGTDHLSFDAVGLPGFQFIQDPLDYGTITHHSDMDTYDHIQAGDLMQASAVIATCVYETANRPGLLPRKPLPPPEPEIGPATRQ